MRIHTVVMWLEADGVHTHTHTHTHTHQEEAKMADDVSLQIENALNSIINMMDKSGNLKKELRQEIHTTVSKLRKLAYALKSELLDSKEANKKMEYRG